MGTTPTKNPWFTIWTTPKETLRSIVSENPRRAFFWLSSIYGLPLAFNLIQNLAFASLIPFWALLCGALVVCPFLGMAGIYVASALLHMSGKWIGGRASFLNIRAAVAWSNVPNIVTVGMWLMLLGIFGVRAFERNFAQTQFTGMQAGILFLAMLVELVISVWGFVILITGLSEVQGFSLWRAILNVIIPFVAVVALVWFVGWSLYGMGVLNH